jgi:hypothetical protein
MTNYFTAYLDAHLPQRKGFKVPGQLMCLERHSWTHLRSQTDFEHLTRPMIAEHTKPERDQGRDQLLLPTASSILVSKMDSDGGFVSS